jgi:hypothetical protein
MDGVTASQRVKEECGNEILFSRKNEPQKGPQFHLGG